MSDVTNDEVILSVRDALLSDPGLVNLLGGRYVFEAPPHNATHPYITISQTKVADWSMGCALEGQRTVTLQVWPHSGERLLAQKFLETVHDALDTAGLISGNASIRLRPEYSGSRKMPEGDGFHGILRYHAECQKESAEASLD